VSTTYVRSFGFTTILLSSALVTSCADLDDSTPASQREPAPTTRTTSSAVTTAFPVSKMITGLTWDFTGRTQLAAGSDLWPMTWGSDGNVWTSWGDGGGFSGSNTAGVVSLGFAKIAGTPPAITGTNVWGNSPSFAQFPAAFCGKAEAMLSVNGTLYAWVAAAYHAARQSFISCPADPSPNQTRLAMSTDLGAHFTEPGLVVDHTLGTIFPKRFINFGKDYQGARDGFVYIVGQKITNATTDDADGKAYLIRVPSASIATLSAWQYMTGLDANGNPTWGAASAAQPMWQDPNDFFFEGLTYHPATNRYLLSAMGSIQDLAIYDAPQPWGPWTTVYATHTWGPSGAPFGTSGTLGISYPEPWMSTDGKTIWTAFSSDGTIVKDTTFAPAVVPPLTGRVVSGSFFKMHSTVAEPNGTGTCSTAQTSSEQIACLVGAADRARRRPAIRVRPISHDRNISFGNCFIQLALPEVNVRAIHVRAGELRI